MDTLEHRVKEFYSSLDLTPDACVGVALSGGGDSVALLAATVASGVRCVALHCNFHLRGAESDRDEEFAGKMAHRFGCEFLNISFDTLAEARKSGESIEMACRSLRYGWFDTLLASGRVKFVALGHHAADNVETFMINLGRSGGLKGLCGIPQRRGGFIRPLLHIQKSEILDYLRTKGLDYVTDSTNLENECGRNVWRNLLLPSIEREFPGFARAVGVSMQNLDFDRELLATLVAERLAACADSNGNIALDALASDPQGVSLLWHAMNRGGTFTRHAAEQVLDAYRNGRSGRLFYSSEGFCYELHRGCLCPGKGEQTDESGVVEVERSLIQSGGVALHPVGLRFEALDISEFAPARDASVIWLDYEAVNASAEPLLLRRWRRGDRIAPFGMKGSRLVSDVFSDLHLSLAGKRRQWLLACGDLVLWIVGVRCSRHFAVTPSTKQVLKISVV